MSCNKHNFYRFTVCFFRIFEPHPAQIGMEMSLQSMLWSQKSIASVSIGKVQWTKVPHVILNQSPHPEQQTKLQPDQRISRNKLFVSFKQARTQWKQYTFWNWGCFHCCYQAEEKEELISVKSYHGPATFRTRSLGFPSKGTCNFHESTSQKTCEDPFSVLPWRWTFSVCEISQIISLLQNGTCIKEGWLPPQVRK